MPDRKSVAIMIEKWVNFKRDYLEISFYAKIGWVPFRRINVEGRYIFMKSKIFVKFLYSSNRQLYCCDITDISTVPPERAVYKKLTKNFETII